MIRPRCPECGIDEIIISIAGEAEFPTKWQDGKFVPILSELLDFFPSDGYARILKCQDCGYESNDGGGDFARAAS